MSQSNVVLNQIIAVEHTARANTESILKFVYDSLRKTETLNGLIRTYNPINENEEKFPDERKLVQNNVLDKIKQVRDTLTNIWDLTLTRDSGNCVAQADVVVDGVVLLSNVPSTHLIYLEKQLNELKAKFTVIPSLDPSEDWSWNSNQNYWTSAPVQTGRTKKITEFVIAAPATPQHSAQIREVSKDNLVGYWTSTKSSATLAPTRITEVTGRIDKLIRAVIQAREAANSTVVEQKREGSVIFDYILQ